MKPIIKLIKEEYNKIKKDKKIIKESTNLSGKTIINVDIQPEYETGFKHFKNKWADFLNNNYENNNIIFLFNGPDLGFPSESEYISWLLELGINEEVIDNSTFFDKGYSYFRFCMDEGIDHEQIVNLIKFMIENDINDSRELDEDNFWDRFVEQYGSEDIRELMEMAGDCIWIPDLMNFLKNKSNIVLTGGGIDECLKEVEIALMVLNKPYQILNEFTY
jgi:hypothetical protein